MFVIINGILNNERLHLINFIYSFGAGVTQFFFPFMIHFFIQSCCFNCSMIIMGALILHIIPITMIVLRRDDSSIHLNGDDGDVKKKFPIDLMRKSDESRSRYADIASAAAYDFYPDIKYPSDVLDMDLDLDDVKWNNNPHNAKDGKSRGENDASDDHFLEILDSHRVMNSDGVEILETIAEENDDEEIKFPSGLNIEELNEDDENENVGGDKIDSIYEEINRKHEMQRQHNKLCNFIRRFLSHKYQNLFTIICRQVINPLKRSFVIFRFYPAVILKSIDIFSYLLYIIYVMPNQALKQYRFEERENIVYLITLMGFCWMAYSIAVLKLHKSLRQNCIHYFHLIGLLAKFFGYLCE